MPGHLDAIGHGWNFAQMRNALNNNPALVHETARLSDAEILRLLDARYPSVEGLFFPDTYYFAAGMTGVLFTDTAQAIAQVQAYLDQHTAS